MYLQKRKDRAGNIYYSFSYLDENGKRVRLPKSKHPQFTDEKSAREWAKGQAAFREHRKDKIEKKLAWKKVFYEFDELLEKYISHYQKLAPNFWKNGRTFLEQYVFDFFLNIKKVNNINDWHYLFPEFRDWLEDEARLTSRKNKPLSYSTKNHCINTLNGFISFLDERHLIDHESAIKCKGFADALTATKTFDSVISKAEFLLVYSKLKSISSGTAELFSLLYHTGLRINEALSLPMSFIYGGQLNGALHDELEKQKITYYGYIVLESQGKDKYLKRDDRGVVERKPLKCRKSIHPKNNRTIPIMNKDVWNILVRRYKAQEKLYRAKKYGAEKINYLLFYDLNRSAVVDDLSMAYFKANKKRKTWHDCRHSFCTYFIGETRNYFLAKIILGHKSDSFDRYNHIYEQISLQAKQQTQEIEYID